MTGVLLIFLRSFRPEKANSKLALNEEVKLASMPCWLRLLVSKIWSSSSTKWTILPSIGTKNGENFATFSSYSRYPWFSYFYTIFFQYDINPLLQACTTYVLRANIWAGEPFYLASKAQNFIHSVCLLNKIPSEWVQTYQFWLAWDLSCASLPYTYLHFI